MKVIGSGSDHGCDVQDWVFYNNIYTVGSEIGDKIATAAVSNHHSQQIRLSNNSSIFSAKSRAILLAFKYIATSKHNKCIPFLNSFSCLKLIANKKYSTLLIYRLLKNTATYQSL